MSPYTKSESLSPPPKSRRPPSPPPLPSSRRRSSSSSRRSRSSRSSSPRRSRYRHGAQRDSRRHPVVESRCIGVFGLNVHTTQAKIREIFSKFGPIERIQVVIDAQTKRSRGFCFIYYEDLADAMAAKNECCGLEVDGRRIRVDYSITQRPHTPTPGMYMGRHTGRDRERSERRHESSSGHHSRPRRPRTPPSPPPLHTHSSHRCSRRSRSRSSPYYERKHRRRHRDEYYRSRSYSRSHSPTPRKRSRY